MLPGNRSRPRGPAPGNPLGREGTESAVAVEDQQLGADDSHKTRLRPDVQVSVLAIRHVPPSSTFGRRMRSTLDRRVKCGLLIFRGGRDAFGAASQRVPPRSSLAYHRPGVALRRQSRIAPPMASPPRSGSQRLTWRFDHHERLQPPRSDQARGRMDRRPGSNPAGCQRAHRLLRQRRRRGHWHATFCDRRLHGRRSCQGRPEGPTGWLRHRRSIFRDVRLPGRVQTNHRAARGRTGRLAPAEPTPHASRRYA